MNVLQKLYALLSKTGRQIKFGVPENETADPLVCITSGDGETSKNHLGDFGAIGYPTVAITVYGSDYIEGYDLCAVVKDEIRVAQKDTVKIFHSRDVASGYENGKYVFKSIYKIIQ